MTVYGQKSFRKEKTNPLTQDLKLFWKFLWEVPSGAPKKREKKVLWRGKAWI